MESGWRRVCVVMASGGYPGNYAKGKADPRPGRSGAKLLPDTKVFHAGTALKDGQIVTNGGRVLGVTALGKDLKAAQAAAYAAVGENPFRRRAFPPRHRGEGTSVKQRFKLAPAV